MTDTRTEAGAQPQRDRPGAPVGFVRTVRSELLKMWTLQTTRRLYWAALIIAAFIAVLLCFTIGPTTGVGLQDRAPEDIVSTSLLGTDAAALVLMLTAAGTVGSEYATGMMRTTLTVTPRRTRFLLAKAVTVLLSTLAVGLLAGLVSVLAGQAVLLAVGLPLVDADLEMVRMAVGAATIAPFYAVFATAFSFVFRNTAGGVTAAVVLLFVPTVVGWLPEWFQANVLPFTPGESIHILAGLTPPDSVSYVHPLIAGGTLLAWSAAALAVAAVVLERRDV
ncbi:hypothetical protein [Pseudonocardia sp. NPDC049635]|uniref:hypothetical protein n=1 Tax=Pseudonocardia sp. NPDC049635 TaxID=3155506 RepID=UPI0033D26D21